MPTLRLDGDASGAIKASTDFNRTVGETKKQYDEAAKSAKALEKAAGQIVRSNEAPQDAYNRKMKELAKLVIENKLSHEQAGVAAKRYYADLRRDTQSNLSGLGLELRAQQLKNESLARMNREVRSVGQVQRVAFGEGAAAQVASYFSMFVGPTAVAGAAISAVQQYRAELNKLGGELQGDRAGLGQLTQLAATSTNPPAAMSRLVNESKQIFASGATNTLGQAGDFVYAMDQADLGPRERKLMARALAYGVLPEAKTTATSIAALRTAFPNLTPGQLAGMGIYAGIASPGGADQLIEGAAKSAQQIKTLGWKPEFSLAATSLLTKAYPGKGEGATRLEQFGKQLERFGLPYDPELKGMNPLGTLERIGSRTHGGNDRAELSKYLGNRGEAIQGFRSLYSNRAQLGQLLKGTATADGGFLESAIGVAQQTPEIDIARQSVSSRNTRQISRLRAQSINDLYQSAVDESVTGKNFAQTWAIKLTAALEGLTESMQEGKLRQAIAEGSGSEEWRASTLRLFESMNRKIPDVVPSGRQE